MKKLIFLLFISFISLTELFSQRLPDLIPYWKGNMHGYADSTGKLILSPKWNHVGMFKDGRAVVIDSNGSYVIDTEGKRISRYYIELGDFHFGCAKFQRVLDTVKGINYENNVLTGFIDTSCKEIWSGKVYWEEGTYLTDFQDGYSIGGNWEYPCMYNYYGKRIETFGRTFEVYYNSTKVSATFLEVIQFTKEDILSGVVNNKGKLVVPCKYDEISFVEKENLILARTDLQWKIFNEKGEFIADLGITDNVKYIGKGFYYEVRIDSLYLMKLPNKIIGQWTLDYMGANMDEANEEGGVINFESKGVCGYIDTTGKILANFDGVLSSPMIDGIGYIKDKKGFCGIINREMKFVTPMRYTEIQLIGQGLAYIPAFNIYVDYYGREYYEPDKN